MNKPKTRNENIVVQEIANELLIYDLKDNKAFLLNETSAFVLQQCDGKTDVRTIAHSLAKRKRQPVNEEIVWLAIEQLKENNLLKEAALPSEFIKSNRREMIRKIGLATMLMLPLVTAVTAPKAIQAASNGCGILPVCVGAPGGCCPSGGDICCGSFCCNPGEACCGSTCCDATAPCCGSVCCNFVFSQCIGGICQPRNFP